MKSVLLGSMSLLPMRRFGDPALPRRSVLDGQALELGDPAIYAVTDFKRDYPMTVDAERQIDDALSDMIRLSVRALLVAKEQRLVGLITSYDIQGERPMQFLQSSNYSRHQDIRVVHVMTPWDELMALDWEHVEAARAADLLLIFERTNLTHLLIVEVDRKTSSSTVRALASRARLLRQLGERASALEPGHRRDAGESHQQRSHHVRPNRH
ncbi:MAG: CBS domain-containing protein [Steroidobacteraceae bacterium]|jgi:CBS domain-containing protein